MIIDEEEQKQMIANTLRNSQPINNQVRSLKYGVGNQNLPKPKNKFFTNALKFSGQTAGDFLLGSSTAEALGYRADVMKGQGYTPSYRDQFNTTVDLLRQGKTTEGLVKGAETLLTGTGAVGEGLMLGSAVAGPLAPLLLGAGFVIKGLSKGGKLILQSKTGKQILANFRKNNEENYDITDVFIPKNDTSSEIQILEDNIDIPTIRTEENYFDKNNISSFDDKKANIAKNRKLNRINEYGYDPEESTKIIKKNEIDTSYRVQHQAKGPMDENPIRLDNLTKNVNGEQAGYPDDFYTTKGKQIYAPGPRFKDDEYGIANNESYNIITKAKNNPDREVSIYRAVPDKDNITNINEGDFVTLSKKYAELHGVSGYGPKGNDAGKILEMKVKVKDLYWDGNDVNEFGYFPNNSNKDLKEIFDEEYK
tara:strand:- start:1458 stop:2723 length:1266 start_codon:yes stop_codon:yes gene_type:complete